MNQILSKLNAYTPGLILLAFAAGSVVISMPRSDIETLRPAPELRELDERLSYGSARLSGLISVTNERPVFHASRRPVATPEAPQAPEPVLTLLGVISEDDGKTLAFVKLSTNGALYRIGQGETVGRWRILDIGTEEITVSKDGEAPYKLQING